MKNFSIVLATTLLFITILIPNISSAQTYGAQCHIFSQNMGIGQIGSEVTYLQQALNNFGFPVSVEGVFGNKTALAVARFQEKYASDILTPNGLSFGSGFVGAATRAKLNSLCTNTTSNNTPTAAQTSANTVSANIPSNLSVNSITSGTGTFNTICLTGDCRTAWPSSSVSAGTTVVNSGSSPWVANGNNIYYSNGNVGIGKSNPIYTLDIEGSDSGGKATRIWIKNTSNSGAADVILENNIGSLGSFQIYDSSYVGTTAGVTSANLANFRSKGAAALLIGTQSAAAPIIFATDLTSTTGERMRIDATGNVGIGTTNPSAKLSIGDDLGTTQPGNYLNVGSVTENVRLNVGSSATHKLELGWVNNNGTYPGPYGYSYGQLVTFGCSNPQTCTDALRMEAKNINMQYESGGNVGIGTYTPQFKLDVAGTINGTGLSVSGQQGLTKTINVTQNTTSCSLTFTSGLLTATTCQ